MDVRRPERCLEAFVEAALVAVGGGEQNLEVLALRFQLVVCLDKIWREAAARWAPVGAEVDAEDLAIDGVSPYLAALAHEALTKKLRDGLGDEGEVGALGIARHL